MRLAILGGGSWGTALALTLAPRFRQTSLWVHDPDLAAQVAATRENPVYLPGFCLPPEVQVTSSLPEALAEADIVLGVMPSHHARAVYSDAKPSVPQQALLVSATKGLETGTLQRISEVASETLGIDPGRIAVLAGPSFAREVARGEPAAVVVSSASVATANAVQQAFASSAFRLYTNTDPAGVEIGAALKNVIAIGAGICEGLGLGNNTTAALVTRGLTEITRLAVALGGQPQTLAGLAGLGDLVLTCYGALSRNRQVGIALAHERSIDEITSHMKMVAEGVQTTYAAVELAARNSVDLPITHQMHAILRRERRPREAIRELMERALKSE